MSEDAAALLAAGDLPGAVAAFDRLLAREPANAAAVAGRARCAAGRGDADALRRVRAARRLSPGDATLALLEAEVEFTAGEADAGAILAGLLHRFPGWAAGHHQLASIRLERGEGDAALRTLVAALAAQPADGALWNALIDLQAGAGWYGTAADTAARTRAAGFADPMLDLIEATHAGRAGDISRSGRLLSRVPVGLPGRAELAIRHAMREGDLNHADGLLEAARAATPDSVAVWALSDIVWRATGDIRAAWLLAGDELITVVTPEFDPARLETLAETLRPLHTGSGQPLGQSVRAGTQTRGRLFDRADPIIVDLVRALQRAVDAYREALPPSDETHPLLRHRDRAMHVGGGWSIRLGPDGHHSSHIHNGGILSSAFYVSVPPRDADPHEGWLELGRPPDDLNMTVPPIRTIEPRPGCLALFPSFLYHGTRPIRRGERLTVAFDASARG